MWRSRTFMQGVLLSIQSADHDLADEHLQGLNYWHEINSCSRQFRVCITIQDHHYAAQPSHIKKSETDVQTVWNITWYGIGLSTLLK